MKKSTRKRLDQPLTPRQPIFSLGPDWTKALHWLLEMKMCTSTGCGAAESHVVVVPRLERPKWFLVSRQEADGRKPPTNRWFSTFTSVSRNEGNLIHPGPGKEQ